MSHKNYIVTNPLISVRRTPESAEFIEWCEGEIMGPMGRDYPDHTNLMFLLLRGAIKPVRKPQRVGGN